MEDKKASSSIDTKEQEDTDGTPALEGLNIDDKLEEKLKKHGLNRRNVKTIIHELLHDENVREMLKSNLSGGSDAAGGSSLQLPELKNLRSKKATKMNKEPSGINDSFPKFTDIPFPEEDEDDDEDFVPSFQDLLLLNAEDNASPSTAATSSEVDLNSSIEGLSIDISEIPMSVRDDKTRQRNSLSVLKDLDSCAAELQAIDDSSRARQAEREAEIIAARTRSKLPLDNVGVEDLETTFDPLEVPDDNCIQSTDEDWIKFLSEVFMDDPVGKPNDADDDDDQDPDYNFMASMAEETQEKDDYRDDQATRIPKKEVEELLELLNTPLDYQGHPVEPDEPMEIQSNGSSNVTLSSQPTSVTRVPIAPLTHPRVTVRQHIEMRKRLKPPVSKKPCIHDAHSAHEVQVVHGAPGGQTSLTFTSNDIRTLKLQLRQHVQLLTQVSLMSKNKEEFSNIVHENYALLKEIKQLADHEKTMLGIEKSYFEVPHVDDALRIAQLQIKLSGPVIQLTKFERGKGLLPLPRELATVMSQSPVFCYTHLLPTSAGMKNNGEFMRKIFTPPEDNLLCLGLTQMQGHLHPMYNLIHQYMLPTKHPEQLKCRVSNATYGHYGPNNPIYVYQRTGVVPPSPVIRDPDVGPGTDAPNHFAVKLRQVPDWLHALQHENDPKFVPKREKVKPSPKKIKQIIKSRSVVSLNNGLMIGTSKTPTAIILPTIISAAPGSSGVLLNQEKRIQEIRKSLSPYKRKRKKKDALKMGGKRTKMEGESSKEKLNSSDPRTASLNTSDQSGKNLDDGLNDEMSENQNTKPTTTSRIDEAKTPQTQLLKQGIEIGTDANKNQTQTGENKRKTLFDSPEIGQKCPIKNPDHHTSSYVPGDKENSPINGANLGTKMDDTTKPIETSLPNKIAENDPILQTKTHKSVSILSKTTKISATRIAKKANKVKIDDTAKVTSSHRKSSPSEVAPLEDSGATEEDEEETEEEEQLPDAPTEEEEPKEDSGKIKKKRNSRTKVSSAKLGGRLHRTFPCLAGKKSGGKSRTSSDDQFSRNLRKSAEKVKLLEEDTIVQLDPTRVEKEMLFAEGYLKQLQSELKDKPDVLVQVLEIMSEFALDSSQSPPVLFQRISKLLAPWPQLIQGFAPFLLPEQAYACGLLPEQQVYARARKFLRQLEIRFIDNPQHLNKIINTFRCVAESGVYKEKEMKSSILSMLKSDPYLQEEFLMFFDDERPPESRLNGNWEEIYWTDDLAKDSISTEFEEIHIPISTEDALHTTTDDAPAISSSKTTPPTKQAKSTNQQRSRKRKKIPKHKVKEKDAEDWTSHPRFEEETEDEEPNLHTKPVTSSPVPQVTDIGVISEDALSCSPFKRHTLGSEETVTVSMHKPPTPTGTRTSQETVSISDYKLPSETQSTSQCSSSLPLTPTGSQSPKPSPARGNDINLTQCIQWTREDDATLLGLCKLEGSSEKTFSKVAETLHRPVEDVEKRFQVLMNLLSNVDAADTDTGSLCTDETDSDDSI